MKGAWRAGLPRKIIRTLVYPRCWKTIKPYMWLLDFALSLTAESLADQQFLGRTEDLQVGVPFVCGCICEAMNFSHASTGMTGADD